VESLSCRCHPEGTAWATFKTIRTLHERALAIRETHLGADHRDTVQSHERLAAVVAALENRE
jgi:hypothetical protein